MVGLAYTCNILREYVQYIIEFNNEMGGKKKEKNVKKIYSTLDTILSFVEIVLNPWVMHNTYTRILLLLITCIS